MLSFVLLQIVCWLDYGRGGARRRRRMREEGGRGLELKDLRYREIRVGWWEFMYIKD